MSFLFYFVLVSSLLLVTDASSTKPKATSMFVTQGMFDSVTSPQELFEPSKRIKIDLEAQERFDFVRSIAEKAKQKHFATTEQQVKGLPPVILIPGTGGSQLEARLNKTGGPRFFCSERAEWYRLWLDILSLTPGAIDCFTDNIQVKLVRREGKWQFVNSNGVDVRTVGFGSTEGIEYLDPRLSASEYYATMVKAFKALGYVVGQNLHGAPYDFRLLPGYRDGEFFNDLRGLVEKTYSRNNNTPVVIISHSYGSIQSLVFFNQQTAAWRSKYIGQYYSLGGAYGGSTGAVKAVLSGDSFGIPIISARKARTSQRTFPSNYLFFPDPQVWGNYQMVVTPTKNYTVGQYKELLFAADMGIEYNTLAYVQQTTNVSSLIVEDIPKVFCYFGIDVPTPVMLFYPTSSFDTEPKEITGSGDGTVPYLSSKLCQRWQNVQVKELPNMGHRKITQDPTVIELIINSILANRP